MQKINRDNPISTVKLSDKTIKNETKFSRMKIFSKRKREIKFELIFHHTFPDINSMLLFVTGKFLFLTTNVKLISREWLFCWKLCTMFFLSLFLFLVAFNHDYFGKKFPAYTQKHFLFTISSPTATMATKVFDIFTSKLSFVSIKNNCFG